MEKKTFSVSSEWYKGECKITTYKLEELLGTKLRALYQRRKGRDLYDLYKALTAYEVNKDVIIHCFKSYIKSSTSKIPSQTEIVQHKHWPSLLPSFIPFLLVSSS